MYSNKKLSETDIDIFEKENLFVFPNIYKKFLLEHNGHTFDEGILIYSLEELIETNQYMQIKEYLPEYLAIGDDGGGLVFLMKQEKETKEVVIVYMSVLNIEQCYQKVDDFAIWFNNGCPIKSDLSDNALYGELVDILLTAQPKNGLKDLVQIKNTFNLQISTNEFLKKTKSMPCLLVENITFAKAQNLIEKIGQTDIFSIKKK